MAGVLMSRQQQPPPPPTSAAAASQQEAEHVRLGVQPFDAGGEFRVTDEQLQHLRRHGYVVLPGCCPLTLATRVFNRAVQTCKELVAKGAWSPSYNFPEVGTSADAWAMVKNGRVMGALESVLGRGNVSLPPKGCLKSIPCKSMMYGLAHAQRLAAQWEREAAATAAAAAAADEAAGASDRDGPARLRIDPTRGDGLSKGVFLQRHGQVRGEALWAAAQPVRLHAPPPPPSPLRGSGGAGGVGVDSGCAAPGFDASAAAVAAANAYACSAPKVPADGRTATTGGAGMRGAADCGDGDAGAVETPGPALPAAAAAVGASPETGDDCSPPDETRVPSEKYVSSASARALTRGHVAPPHTLAAPAADFTSVDLVLSPMNTTARACVMLRPCSARSVFSRTRQLPGAARRPGRVARILAH